MDFAEHFVESLGLSCFQKVNVMFAFLLRLFDHHGGYYRALRIPIEPVGFNLAVGFYPFARVIFFFFDEVIELRYFPPFVAGNY